jgi:pimeloyl-ACP methyl ester carboxylesterase
MKKWLRTALGAVAGAGAAGAYMEAMTRRNRTLGLNRPGVRDSHGALLPELSLEYTDGERVSVMDIGSGPPILMVPGADGMKETFRYQYPAFSNKLRVVSADLRSRFSPDDTFDRFAQDLFEIIDARETGPVIVMGQSLGSAIAINFAALFPELVRALVLCNPLANVSYEHVGLNRTLMAPIAMATTRFLPTAASRQLARLWSEAEIWIYDDSPGRANVVDYALWTGPRTVSPRVSTRRVDLLKRVDLRPLLPSIKAPTLVVKGPRDHYLPPEWAMEIAALIPDARYDIVPGTGHCSHISMPGSFNRLVLDWIERVPAAEAAAAAEVD